MLIARDQKIAPLARQLPPDPPRRAGHIAVNTTVLPSRAAPRRRHPAALCFSPASARAAMCPQTRIQWCREARLARVRTRTHAPPGLSLTTLHVCCERHGGSAPCSIAELSGDATLAYTSPWTVWWLLYSRRTQHEAAASTLSTESHFRLEQRCSSAAANRGSERRVHSQTGRARAIHFVWTPGTHPSR